MPFPLDAAQPFNGPPTLGPSVTGGAGITSEADEQPMFDTGAANTPYFLRMVKDINGLVTGAGEFQMDGVTPYGLVGPGVPATGSGGGGGLTQESDPVVLYDQGNNNLPFIRPIQFDGAGGVIGALPEIQLDGSAYPGYVGPDSPAIPVGSLFTREARSTDVTGPGFWDPAAQNISSFQFVVIAGTATWDGVTFNATDSVPGASYGDDTLDEPVVGAGGVGVINVAGPGDTIRVAYTELV